MMTNPLVKVTPPRPGSNGHTYYLMWRPGCEDARRINDTWDFDGNLQSPTFSPNLLTDYGRINGVEKRCHSFIRSGRWEFLTDSTHALAGRTVDMVPLPDHLV